LSSVSARAAVLTAFRSELEIRDVLVEEPRADEIRIRLVATGICHTDQVMADGALRAGPPVVLGHEGAGVVEAVGSAVTTHAVGDHVVLSFAFCGHCNACSEGTPSYCDDFMRRNFSCCRADGSSAFAGDQSVRSHFFGQSSFATYSVCDPRNAIVVTKDVPLELLGPLGCGIQTGAGAVINALKMGSASTFAVFGAGAVGLSAILAARVVGATTIIAVDRNAARLELAATLGATDCVLVGEEDSADHIRQIAPKGVRFTLDTTGVSNVARTAINVLAPRGVCGVVAGAPGFEVPVSLNYMFVGGRSIRGITEGDAVPSSFIPYLIELYQQQRFPFDKMLQFFSLNDINAAMEKAAQGEVVKPVIRF
jgi:aryl-alcohol dehydrogenase